jgi:hypothetical protein
VAEKQQQQKKKKKKKKLDLWIAATCGQDGGVETTTLRLQRKSPTKTALQQGGPWQRRLQR